MLVVLAQAPSLADWIGAAGSLLAAVVAVFLGVFAIWQTRAANAQAEVAREQLRRWQQEEHHALDRVWNDSMQDMRRQMGQQEAAHGIERRLEALERAIRGEPRAEGERRSLPAIPADPNA
jgi:flagellar biosynthesis/type III secretory pathway M-ring protein FliF/YscJ